MASCREFTFPSSDGVHRVHAMEWLPESGSPRGVVQLVHGISEYIGRYSPFARFLTDHGFAVVGHDHLGHRKPASGREEYGYFADQDGWRHIRNDIRFLRTAAGERFPGLPYFLLGHSMGSFAVRLYLIDFPGTVDGCLLSGTGQEPALLVEVGRLLSAFYARHKGPRYVSRLLTALSLGGYNLHFRPNRTTVDWISRDTAVVDAYAADPMCRFVPTVGMFHDMMEALQYIARPENLRKMDPSTPVYLFSGDRDPVGSNGRGVQKVYGFFQKAGTRDLRMKLYPGGRHEMLNEINRDEVYADVLAWLEEHLP